MGGGLALDPLETFTAAEVLIAPLSPWLKISLGIFSRRLTENMFALVPARDGAASNPRLAHLPRFVGDLSARDCITPRLLPPATRMKAKYDLPCS